MTTYDLLRGLSEYPFLKIDPGRKIEFQACDAFVFSEISANFSPSDCLGTLLPYLHILIIRFESIIYHYCLNPISFHTRSHDLAFFDEYLRLLGDLLFSLK